MPNHNQVRVMNNNGRVYIDLADERGHVIEIGQYGWTVTETVPVSFMRTPHTLPLPVPERGGSIDELWDMFDVSDDFFISIIGWLLGALCGDGVHPILTINSPNASKLPLTILRSLADPSSAAPFSGVPRSKRQLREANLGYLFAFDHMPEITGEISVALRRLSAGHPQIVEAGGCEASLDLTKHLRILEVRGATPEGVGLVLRRCRARSPINASRGSWKSFAARPVFGMV
jgi:hypothetical protein